MKKFTTALIAGASVMFAAASANALVIDSFDGTTFTNTADFATVGAGNATGDLAGIVRMVQATSTGSSLNVGINTGTTPGAYSHSQDTGVTGQSSITYMIGAVDLTEMMTANAFRIEINSIDLNAVIGIRVDGNLLGQRTVVGILTAIDIPFGAETANLQDGAVIELFIDGTGTSAVDAEIDQFGTACTANTSVGPASDGVCRPPVAVSEPASLGLLGLGLVGLGAAARRRKA